MRGPPPQAPPCFSSLVHLNRLPCVLYIHIAYPPRYIHVQKRLGARIRGKSLDWLAFVPHIVGPV